VAGEAKHFATSSGLAAKPAAISWFDRPASFCNRATSQLIGCEVPHPASAVARAAIVASA